MLYLPPWFLGPRALQVQDNLHTDLESVNITLGQ
jgi:hypothetical protein